MKSELQNYQNNQSLIRSYGRIKSRKLSNHKNFLLENLATKYEISNQFISDSSSNLLKKSFEIGFGFGDFLFAKAKSNQDQIFFGSEPHINGVVNLLAKLENENLENIKFSRRDARELLMEFPDNFFDEIYILFPDPWPKSKHFKRRLINVEFLDKVIANKIKGEGNLIIATDHHSYKTWILSAILQSKKFKWNAHSKLDWQNFPSDWILTKYQKKAKIEGRVSAIFNLKKIT